MIHGIPVDASHHTKFYGTGMSCVFKPNATTEPPTLERWMLSCLWSSSKLNDCVSELTNCSLCLLQENCDYYWLGEEMLIVFQCSRY